MKFKYLIIVSLILTILALGVVSASDECDFENLTVCEEIDVEYQSDLVSTIDNDCNLEEYEIDSPVSDSFDGEDNDSLLEDGENSGKANNSQDSMYLNGNVPEEMLRTGDSWNSYVDLPENASGDVDFYVDGNYRSTLQYKDHYRYQFSIYNYTLGKHTLEFRYLGNIGYYSALNKTYEFEAVDAKITIFNETTVEYWDYVYIELPYDASGEVSVYVDGDLFKNYTPNRYEDESIIIQCSLSSLPLGEHEIEVRFAGDSKYQARNKSGKTNLTYKINKSIYDGYIFYYGQNANKYYNGKISITLPSDITSKPIIKIDGIAWNYTESESELHQKVFTADVSNLGIGNHTMYVSYADGRYPFKSANVTFTVIPVIIADFYESPEYYGISLNYGSGSNITLELPDDANGNLSLYIYKKSEGTNKYNLYKTSDFKNGLACIMIDDLNIGYYSAYINYTGNDYEVKSVQCSIEVFENIIYPTDMVYGEDKYLVIKSDNSDNRKFTFKINDKVYGNIQLKNGNGKLSLKDLPVGQSVAIMIYYNNSHYDTIFIDVYPRLSGGKNIKMYYCDGSTYSVKAYGDHGVPVGKNTVVTIQIGNKKYSVKTNAKGVASLKIVNAPGKYKITAIYKGVKFTNQLVIKHVLSLKSVPVKKSAKKLVLTATLKIGKKPIKSKTVTFKFNGKTYKAKTNKKGVAKVTIKKAVLKKLKVGKKITYKATYNKDTVKKSVKIRK